MAVGIFIAACTVGAEADFFHFRQKSGASGHNDAAEGGAPERRRIMRTAPLPPRAAIVAHCSARDAAEQPDCCFGDRIDGSLLVEFMVVNETFGSDVHTTQQFTAKFGSLLLKKSFFPEKSQ